MPWGSLLLWGCGDRFVVSWWILDNPRRTQNRILFGFSSMYHYFSVFLCIQKSFCDITHRCWCSHKLILCLVFGQLQEMPHWGCVERQKMLEEFAFGIIFDKAGISIPLSMSFSQGHDFMKQQVSSSHSAPRETHPLVSQKNNGCKERQGRHCVIDELVSTRQNRLFLSFVKVHNAVHK